MGTALHATATKGWHGLAKQLLSGRADVNRRNEDGETPLHFAAEAGHFVKWLLGSRSDANAYSKNAMTPLHYAARSGMSTSVEELLTHQPSKVDINACNNSKEAALHVAARAGHTNILRQLLKARADIELKNKDEETAFEIVDAGNELAWNLIPSDVVVTKNASTSTVLRLEKLLMIAAKDGNEKKVHELLEMEAGVSCKLSYPQRHLE